MWVQVRTVSIADGPSEAHLKQLGRRENEKAGDVSATLRRQMEVADKLMRGWNTEDTSVTHMRGAKS
jgi:hypothetical protein